MKLGRNRQPLSRAEQLRQKRQQTVVQRRPAAESKPAPRTTPRSTPAVNRSVAHVSPVVSRSIRYGTPLRETVTTQPRRKVYYAVGANGVETRLPSLPIIHFNWQWVSGILTLGCLVLALLMTNLSIFKVNVVNVEGMQRVTPADLQPIIQQNASSVFTLNKPRILTALAIAFPELKDIHFSLSLPDGVNVSAVERQPVLIWKAGDYTFWIDAEGVVMSPRGDAGQLLTIESNNSVPQVRSAKRIRSVVDYAEMVIEQKTNPLTPEDSMDLMDPEVMKAAIEMSAIMPAGSTLVYDTFAGMGWRDPGGWKVYFGNDLSNIQFKQVEYQAIMQQLANQGINPVMINLKHVDSPYYRTE